MGISRPTNQISGNIFKINEGETAFMVPLQSVYNPFTVTFTVSLPVYVAFTLSNRPKSLTELNLGVFATKPHRMRYRTS